MKIKPSIIAMFSTDDRKYIYNRPKHFFLFKNKALTLSLKGFVKGAFYLDQFTWIYTQICKDYIIYATDMKRMKGLRRCSFSDSTKHVFVKKY